MTASLRVQAAAGRLRAAMEVGHQTPEELAQALEDCRLLQSPETAAARAERTAVRLPAFLEERHTVGLDVAEDSPAADLALRLRLSQHDVTHTDVRSATKLRITVRPQSVDCLRWWICWFEAGTASGAYMDGEYTVRGRRGDVAVDLTIVGDAVPAWLEVAPHAS
ncbi:hypothetical protein ACGFZK_32635 [Streptomyces sp. NPDC048257]|uniref:hypothetical protein n=1 Tax=Streptomyces sp. NPDC048257 TaxID=3365526 RepID=UPI003711FA9E